jgi:signal transduction histidine kinase
MTARGTTCLWETPGYRVTMTISVTRPPLTRRLRAGHWIILDAALGVFLGVYGTWLGLRPSDTVLAMPWWLIAVLAWALGLAVALRRVRPWLSVSVVAAASPFICVESLHFPYLVPPAIALVLYTLGERKPRRAAWLALAVVLGAMIGILLLLRITTGAGLHHGGLALLVLLPIIIGVWMIGLATGASRAYTAGLRARAREQVAEERLRIARELHDVIAHSMSLITMQASVANYLVETRPQEAGKALSSIEATGRNTLREMRLILGMLREGDGDGTRQAADLAPAPGLDDVDRLIARTAEAGLRVEFQVNGTRRDLPVGVELAGYRIVQEALTNVLKHADARRGTVVVDYGPDAVRIEVTDDGRGAPDDAEPGHGLVGMRERVAAYGGAFEAGSLPGRGFRVAARIPAEAAPA